LRADHASHPFSDSEHDLPELKSRIAPAIGFRQGLPHAAIAAAGDKEVIF
jgi:hypothetical protein